MYDGRTKNAAQRCLHFLLKGRLECNVGQDCCSVYFVCRSSQLYVRVIHRQVVELRGEETDPLNWHDKRIRRKLAVSEYNLCSYFLKIYLSTNKYLRIYAS